MVINKYNIVPLREIGDIVYYTGIVDYTDSYTMSLMRSNLIPCKPYTIHKILKFYGDTTYCSHYEFIEESANFLWYPCNSFSSNVKDCTRKKYNLK